MDASRVFINAIITCTLAYSWLHLAFLSPLKEEARVMHQRQLDPTDIVKIPYDIQRLGLYVLGTVFVLLLLPVATTSSNGRTFTGAGADRMELAGVYSPLQKIQQWILVILACLGAMFLCGASLVENVPHTILAAVYLATLAWFEPPLFPHQHLHHPEAIVLTTTAGPRDHRVWEALGGRWRGQPPGFRSAQGLLATAVTHGCLAGTIPLQILLLYDRGWQVQRWPVPVVLGSTYGWIAGVLFGSYWVVQQRPGPTKQR